MKLYEIDKTLHSMVSTNEAIYKINTFVCNH